MLVAVVSCCLAQFRLSSSTLSAQPPSSEPPSDDEINDDNRELAASYARYSSDNQDKTSIIQQHEKNGQAAVRNGHQIPKSLEFSDEAISGTILRRAGLDAVVAGAKQGKFRIIYFWNISRLAREVAISIPLLKELVKVYGIRIVCVSESIDSLQPSWELNALFNSYMAQEYVTRLREDVKRGIRYALDKGFSVGDACFGYKTEPLPGCLSSGKKGKERPRKKRAIDPDAAQWVVRIFYWYVEELRSINWIRNELNRKGAPKDLRSSSRKGWLNTCVRNVLANPKYVGLWRYGLSKVVINPLTGVKKQVKRKVDDPEVVTLHFPDLRIIDDVTFEKAQARLRENEEKTKNYRYKSGKFKGSSHDSQAPRHLLQGFIKCKQCGNTLQQNGLRGRYLQCSAYPRNECTVKTSLLRSFAEKEILRIIGKMLLEDQRLRSCLLAVMKAAWEQHHSQSPLEKEALERRKREIEKKIENLVNQVEAGASPPDIVARLSARRLELIEIDRKLESLSQTPLKLDSAPTEEWVIEQLTKLEGHLHSEPALAGVGLRKLIGSIVVSEVAFPGLKRKKLVGKFRLSPSQVLASISGLADAGVASEEEEITICFAELPAWAQRADEVKELYDANRSAVTIAAQLGLKFGAIAKALNWWYTQRGLPVPSGNEKRARIIYAPKRDLILADVMKCYHEGWPIERIASEFSCSTNTITAMVKKWHEDQGLPWVHGKIRQRQLRLKRESDKKNNQDAA